MTADDAPATADVPNAAVELDETAEAILNAASRRFMHYGYGKTTMSEIAGDCNMSTGNVYRYFPSKLDIAEAFVRRIRTEQIARLREAVNGAGMKAPERLRLFFQTKLKLAYERFHDKPKAFELSAEILNERPQCAIDWENAESKVIAEILEEGRAEGAFAICNKRRTARILQDAAFRFTSPMLYHEGDYETLASELDEVFGLILDGFAYRAGRECVDGGRDA